MVIKYKFSAVKTAGVFPNFTGTKSTKGPFNFVVATIRKNNSGVTDKKSRLQRQKKALKHLCTLKSAAAVLTILCS
jgi:hypothetical protein